MATYHLRTPIAEKDARSLKVNDVVYISGTIITARDQAHRRALSFLKKGKALPMSLEGLAVYHCGPVMRKQGEGYVTVAAGPTTSTRLEPYEDEFLRAFKPRLLVGKGGMGRRTADALKGVGAAYCAFTGGAAVLAANAVRCVREVHWLDLGMPEAMWVLEVHEFGPVIVAIDSRGGNLYADVAAVVEANKQRIHKKLG